MSITQLDSGLAGDFIVRRAHLRAVAERILGCRQRAEDVVQDAFLRLLENTNVGHIEQTTSYLTRVVRNLAIDQYRRAAFESEWFLSEEYGGGVATRDPPLDAQLCNRESIELVEKVLAGLPARTRAALILNRIQGLTQREVAKQLHISPTLVNFMIRDALEYCLPRLRALS